FISCRNIRQRSRSLSRRVVTTVKGELEQVSLALVLRSRVGQLNNVRETVALRCGIVLSKRVLVVSSCRAISDSSLDRLRDTSTVLRVPVGKGLSRLICT